jgi:endonuclease YncB( thermonuclease family)
MTCGKMNGASCGTFTPIPTLPHQRGRETLCRTDASFGKAAWLGIVFLIGLGGALALAEDMTAKANKALSGDEIALTDGRVVRLAEIKAAAPEARAFMQSTVVGHAVALREAATDRYGRIAATLYVDGQAVSVQEALVTNGLAFVYPAVGDDALLDTLLVDEKAARVAKRGWWADHADTSSDDAEKLYGSYGFVSGTVVKAERVKNKFYLNFGADWRTDFTIAVAAHDLRAFKKAGLDLETFEGKRVRVRGWVKRDFGPMITITDPHQIEVLD